MKTKRLTTLCCRVVGTLALLAILHSLPAHAQLAYSGPPGAELMQKARRLQAAGDRAGAAATFQRAYEAYTSVDDSDGMTAALAGKKAAETGGATVPATRSAVGAAPRPAATPTPRPAAPAAAGPAPVAGHMVGNKPVGLFFVTKFVLGNLRTLTYYFSPDGVAYEDPPGLSAAQLAAAPAKSKGRYAVAGKTLTIAWNGYPKPESAEMSMLGGGFSWSGGSIFSAVGPFRSPSQLVGSFEGGSSVAVVGAAVLSSRTLTFCADGTYTGGGVVSYTSVNESSVAEGGGSSKQVGHWRLDGWYLALTDAQGHILRDIAYPVGDGKGKVTLFNFNGTAYSRQ